MRKATARAYLRPVEEDEGQQRKPKRWQGDDEILLHKRQIRVGVRLLCFGRIDHGVVWRIVEIKTYPSGGTRGRKVPAAATYQDTVTMHNARGEVRHMSVANLSYSAIWRLP